MPLDMPMTPLAIRVNQKLSRKDFIDVANAIAMHGDTTFEDLKRGQSIVEGNFKFAIDFRFACPYQPVSIAWWIREVWGEAKYFAEVWEESFVSSPTVLHALARKYQDLDRLEDAMRCLKKWIAIYPTHGAYHQLARIYRMVGNRVMCKETLKVALEVPSYGSESDQTRIELAKFLIEERDWKGAYAYAIQAAQSNADWAVLTAGRCAEATEQWSEAESFHRALSERFQNFAADWYFWCIRTNRGDIDTARSLAERYWKTLRPPFEAPQRWSRGIGYLMDDDLRNAIATMKDSSDRDRDAAALMLAAVLADKSGNDVERDSTFEMIIKLGTDNSSYLELVNLFKLALASREEFHWNRTSFDSLVVGSSGSVVTSLYYFAGEFLGKHEQQELSREYLSLAATSFDVDSLACLLANRALRLQHVEIGLTRSHERPDNLAPISAEFTLAESAEAGRRHAEALTHFGNAISLNADFSFSLVKRGEFQERRGNYDDAIEDYRNAIKIDPDSDAAHRNLAWLLATNDREGIRNGREALEHARRAFDLREVKTARIYSALAAAHAECGDFKQALEFESMANSANPMQPAIWERIQLYQQRKPIRRSPVPGTQHVPRRTD